MQIEEDIVSASIDYKKKYETGVEFAQVLDEVKVEVHSWIYSDK